MEKIFNLLDINTERSKFSFKNNFPFRKRKDESNKIMIKYPDRIPIICQRSGKNVPDLDKKKYLVPDDLTLGQFLYVIRKRMKLRPEMSIYLFVGEDFCIPNNTTLMTNVYHEHSDADGFLYISYSGENTFG